MTVFSTLTIGITITFSLRLVILLLSLLMCHFQLTAQDLISCYCFVKKTKKTKKLSSFLDSLNINFVLKSPFLCYFINVCIDVVFKILQFHNNCFYVYSFMFLCSFIEK